MARLPDANEDFENLQAVVPDRHLPTVWLNPIVGFPRDFTEQENGGGVVRLDMEDRLQSFVYDDSARKRDKATITFIDDSGQFSDPNNLVHGAEIEVAWGYRGLLSARRTVIVKRVKLGMVQGRKWARRRRGFLVTVECLDRTTQQHTLASPNHDLFENLKISMIARAIAERMGYHENKVGKDSLKISIPPEWDVSYSSLVRPSAMTYPQFLGMIAENNDLMYKVGKNGLFFGVREDEAPSPYVVNMDGETLMGFELDGDLVLGTPAALTVRSFNPKNQKIGEAHYRLAADARGNGNALAVDAQSANENPGGAPGEVEAPDGSTAGLTLIDDNTQKKHGRVQSNKVKEDFKPSTGEKMNEKALQYFFARAKRVWKLKLRLVGDPEMGAGKTINLMNFETRLLDGLWFIEEARHTIDAGGYVTELVCTRKIPASALKGKITFGTAEYRPFVQGKGKNKNFDPNQSIEGGGLIENDTKFTGQFTKPGKRRKGSHKTDGVHVDHTFDPKL